MSSGIKLSEVADLRYQLDQNLCGDGGEQWLMAFKKFLRKENPWPTVANTSSTFVAWKTITLGLHRTPADYRKALKQAGYRISDYADDILNQVSIAQEPCDIALALVSVADLGFTGATRFDRICARAKERGLELCLAEDGLALRLAYAEQASGDWFRIAMEPLAARGRDLGIFSLEHGSVGRWLGTRFGDPDFVRDPENRFVFRLPVASISP